jgi:hypothetical protein
VDASELRGVLEGLKTQLGKAQGCQIAWSLGDLVGLEIWLQEFFGEHQLN